MIRRLLVRALDAVIDRLAPPEPVATPASAPPAVATPTLSKWSSPQFHVETLKSTACPQCNGAKRVGSYRCDVCKALPLEG